MVVELLGVTRPFSPLPLIQYPPDHRTSDSAGHTPSEVPSGWLNVVMQVISGTILGMVQEGMTRIKGCFGWRKISHMLRR